MRRPDSQRVLSFFWLLLLPLLICVGSSRVLGVVAFTPPEDSVDIANELKAIDRELADRNYASAARRLESLLAARHRPLASLSERTLTSIEAWMEQIPGEVRGPLAMEHGKQSGVAARRALEALRAAQAKRPDEFYALSKRYPLTDSAPAALASAGDLAMRLGDFPAAQAYYELAKRSGLALDDGRERQLELLKQLTGGASIPDDAAPSGKTTFTGALPFDATWYGNPSAMGHAKFFPAAFDDRILLSSWRTVTMLRDDGAVLWSDTHSKAPGAFNTDRAPSGGQGALFAPGVLYDVQGQPVLLVVRQPGARGDSPFVLRALRATDGKPLWSTETTAGTARNDLSYAGLPAVCGRYVYSIAVARTDVSTANFVLSALDVMTGEPLWQTTIGAVTEQGDGAADRNFGRKFGRNPPLALDQFAALSEPAIVGDLVVLAPNCGSVIAVDRFNGNVRWVSAYRATEIPQRTLLTRYRSTPVACGNVIVALPQDAAALYAFNRATGKRLWESDTAVANAFALVGRSGNMAVVDGASVIGIDAGGTGKLKWKFTPARGVHLTGPAVVRQATVLVPTTLGVVQLDVADGSEKTAYKLPHFRQLLASEAGRAISTESGASASFGLPPAAR